MNPLVLISVSVVLLLVLLVLMRNSKKSEERNSTASTASDHASSRNRYSASEPADSHVEQSESTQTGVGASDPDVVMRGESVWLWIESPSSDYRLEWRDGGSDERKKSTPFRLLFKGKLKKKGTLPSRQIWEPCLSDAGVFIFCGENKKMEEFTGQTFFAYSSDGECVIEDDRKANLTQHKVVSNDGLFAVCSSNWSRVDDEDSGKSFLYDLSEGRTVWKSAIVPDWLRANPIFSIDSQRRKLWIQTGPISELEVDFDTGEVDPQTLAKILLTSRDRAMLEGLAELYLSSEVELSNEDAVNLGTLLSEEFRAEAKCLRSAGKIFERLGQDDRAIENFTAALEKNPNMGVKKLISDLKKKQGLEIEYGPAICPNCHCQLEEFPKRKRKCPECQAVISIWKDGESRTLVSADEEQELKARRDATKLEDKRKRSEATYRNKWLRKMDRWGVEQADFDRVREKCQSGPDAIWSLFQEAMERREKKGDVGGLPSLYSDMALFLHEEGRDPCELLAQAQKASLNYQENLGTDVVRIAASHCCDACALLDGKKMKLEEARSEMLIPNPDCTRKKNDGEHALCQCGYSAFYVGS